MADIKKGLCFFNLYGRCNNAKCPFSHQLEEHHLRSDFTDLIEQVAQIEGPVKHCRFYFLGDCNKQQECEFQHLLKRSMLSDKEVARLDKLNEATSKKKDEQAKKKDKPEKNNKQLVTVKQESFSQLTTVDASALALQMQMMQLKHEHDMEVFKLTVQKDMAVEAHKTEIKIVTMEAKKDVEIATLKGDIKVAETKAELKPQATVSPQIVHIGGSYPLPGYPFYPADTVLLTPVYHSTISAWAGRPNVHWILRYRGSRNGFSASVFHSLCNHVGPTVTIIRSNSGYLFGGYNPNNWGSSNTYQGGGGSFLFTLTNAYGHGPTVFHFSTSNGPYDHSSYGPTWGGGHDLHINNNMTSNSNYSNFPSSYSDTLGYGNNTFAGSKNFVVAEIEVFSV